MIDLSNLYSCFSNTFNFAYRLHTVCKQVFSHQAREYFKNSILFAAITFVSMHLNSRLWARDYVVTHLTQ